MREEVLLILFVAMIVGTLLAIGPVLAIVAIVKVGAIRRLREELEELRAEVGRLKNRSERAAGGEGVGERPAAPTEVVATATPFAAPSEATRAAAWSSEEFAPIEAVVVVDEASGSAAPSVAARKAADSSALELFIGRKALGWVAVVVLLFGAGFFLRYAYENQWIGPLGRVAIGAGFGVALTAAGRRYDRLGWRGFSRMLTSAGVLVLYLSTYSAFGFYHLVPPGAAGPLLVLIVAESALLALVYDSWAVALMAIVGGLLTPVLMRSDHDQYASLFTYLAVLNAGSLALLVRRAWPAIGTIGLLGTQLLFWIWYAGQYHPEKLAWAAGFQTVLYGLHWAHSVASSVWRRRGSTAEEAVRGALNATLFFAAIYVLLSERHRDWLGAAAVTVAAVEALGARWMVRRPDASQARLLTSVAISVGFISLAFPLQADAHWVAVGWAAQAAVLFWCGLRVESTTLRVMAGALGAGAFLRVLTVNAPWTGRPEFIPIWNSFAAPSLAVVLLASGGLYAARGLLRRASTLDRLAAGAGVAACVLLTWFVLSMEVYQYFIAKQDLGVASSWDLRRTAQMSLSALWATFATAVLAAGFVARFGILRWTALTLYGVTVLKVFFVDMAGLDEIYRIVAFLLLAVLLGAAAWAYQRITPPRD